MTAPDAEPLLSAGGSRPPAGATEDGFTRSVSRLRTGETACVALTAAAGTGTPWQAQPMRLSSKMHRSSLIFIMLAGSAFSQDQTKQEQIGQGEWNLVFKTETATGTGCSELGIDQEIRTGLVIAPKQNQVCSRDSPECSYVFKWKVRLDDNIDFRNSFHRQSLFACYISLKVLMNICISVRGVQHGRRSSEKSRCPSFCRLFRWLSANCCATGGVRLLRW